MLIYNVKSRKATIGKAKGQTVYYAQAVPQGRLTARAVEDILSEKTTLTRGDIRHAITSLAELVRWALSEGLSVDLADLGSLKVEATSKITLKEEDVNASILNEPRIRFYPRKEMRQYAKSVSISVRNGLIAESASSTAPSGGLAGSPGGVGVGTGGSL